MTGSRDKWLRVLAVPVALALAVSACTTHSGSTDTARTTGLARTGGRRRRITIRDGHVSPGAAVVELAVGETLMLMVVSDADAVLQAPGLAADQSLEAGLPGTVWLVGTRAGVHRVELGDRELLLLEVAVA